MDWLKDKKNQPIVAAILAVVIIGAGAAVYFTMFRGGEQAAGTTAPATTETTTTTTTEPGMGPPPGGAPPTGTEAMQPGMTGTAATPGTTGAPGAAQAASVQPPPGGSTPMEPWRDDPFLPLGYKPKKTGPKPKPHIRDFPFQKFAQWVSPEKKPPPPELEQPARRVAGIIVSDRVYAIIETVGKPNMEIVQPGDVLEDRLAKVERIERDRVVLKTLDKVPKYISLPLTSAPRTTTTAATIAPAFVPEPGVPMPGPRGGLRGPYGAGAGEPMSPM
ncbi:MAG: hypothetical protein QHI38_07720 [Armatimonadota bacterium]|nr:hypothetical protein [Armatimonadota bacterium]